MQRKKSPFHPPKSKIITEISLLRLQICNLQSQSLGDRNEEEEHREETKVNQRFAKTIFSRLGSNAFVTSLHLNQLRVLAVIQHS